MGQLIDFVKGGVDGITGQLKNMDFTAPIRSAVDSASINFKVPKINTSDITSNIKLDNKLSDFKMPAGATSYLSPIASKVLNHVKLPSEIGGVALPTFPDLSSVTPQIEGLLSGVGIDMKGLGLRSVGDILKTPNLSDIAKVDFANPVDLDNLPDLTKSLDDFDIDGLQSQINSTVSQIPGADSIDISKYF